VPKYLFKSHYTAEGLEGLLKDGGTARRSVVEKSAADLGGSVESFYFAFGDDDVFCVLELPDNSAAAKISMVIGAAGRAHTTVVPLLTVDDVDRIAAGSMPSYTPPGG
jgi:uncharacterized protein with GYD domain